MRGWDIIYEITTTVLMALGFYYFLKWVLIPVLFFVKHLLQFLMRPVPTTQLQDVRSVLDPKTIVPKKHALISIVHECQSHIDKMDSGFLFFEWIDELSGGRKFAHVDPHECGNCSVSLIHEDPQRPNVFPRFWAHGYHKEYEFIRVPPFRYESNDIEIKIQGLRSLSTISKKSSSEVTTMVTEGLTSVGCCTRVLVDEFGYTEFTLDKYVWQLVPSFR